MRKHITPYLLLLPTFVIIVLFIYYPAYDAFYSSFYRISVFGNRRIFVGLKNYLDLFRNPDYLNSVSFSLIYTFVTVTASLFLGFFLALLLDQKIPGIRIYRTMIFAPYAISYAIAGALWGFLLNPVVGHVNYLMLRFFGIQTHWLITRPYAAYSLIFASVWKILPFNVIFYLAALQSLPGEVLEASTIDGASSWIRIWRIIFPLVSPITFYLVIMNIISATFQSFAIVDVMTKGGPGNYTTTLIYRLYLDGFRFQKLGPASAQNVILFLVMIVVTVIYFFYGQKKVHYQ
ncbi:carbohydrate ABC transporter permease [Pseudothermotoga thermarum]|uniref:Carbohydrate ABC transporter membrane protein 1, CUT1 family n=1 Tax=Pseudothermotoga thermarum DSM 5069 TaxID=688269 RepID=F7YV48_9THEM|nr:sugar ABC transporter permease [Pseudothermotoga thermarum]AEH50347.1 carbohydrate ABC transporter membrane protein 1, CUT1 family [Pseudothermotoga thermarum DSM 5069]